MAKAVKAPKRTKPEAEPPTPKAPPTTAHNGTKAGLGSAVVVSETTLGALRPDEHNARRHTPRNIGVITDSLQQLGAARSIVIDEENTVLAGNGVVEAAGEAGLERVVVVEASGNEIIAVRRRGLTQQQKVDLALRDNRATELSSWDPDVLKEISAEMDLSHLFSDNELDQIISQAGKDDVAEQHDPYPEMPLRAKESYNYVVLVFRDVLGWDRAQEVLGLQKMKTKHGGVTKVGLGRVMSGDEVLDRLVDSAARR